MCGTEIPVPASPPKGSDIGRRWRRRAPYWIALVLATAVVFAIFLHPPGLNRTRRATFVAMVEGTAHRPFAYRVLLPMTVRLVRTVTPSVVRQSLDDSIGGTDLVRHAFGKLGWEEDYFFEYATALVLMYASLVGFALSVRYLCTGLYEGPELVADLASLAAVVILPAIFGYCNYIYDFPALFLFTLGLALMVRRKWGVFLIVFLAGCLNKETAILLTVLYVIHFLKGRRMQRGLFVKLLVVQLAVFVMVKLGLHLALRSNPGAFVRFHLVDHNLRLLKPFSLPGVFTFLALVFVTFRKWSEKPEFLRHGIWIPVLLLVLTLFLGYLDELRDYYEAVPIVVLLATDTVAAACGVRLVNIQNGKQPEG